MKSSLLANIYKENAIEIHSDKHLDLNAPFGCSNETTFKVVYDYIHF